MALDLGTLVASLEVDDTNWNNTLDKAEKKSTGFGDSAESMFSSVAGVAAGVFAGIQVGKFFADGISYASDLNETINKSSTIFGAQGDAMKAWSSKASTTLGMSQQAALNAAAGFGDMFTQIGFTGDAAASMSQDVVQAAADLGSFSNLDTADVADRLSAAFRGEYDSLQAVIPNINAARVESEALAMTGKKTADELTAQEKAAAVLAIVHGDGARAMGDFSKTSDGYANSQKIVAAQMEEVSGKVGNLLLPILQSLQGILLDYIIPAFETVVNWIGQNIEWLGPLATGISIAVGALVALNVILWILSINPFTLLLMAIVLGIGLLIGAIILLVQNWETVSKFITDVWNVVMEWLKEAFHNLLQWWDEMWGNINRTVTSIWEGIVNWLTDSINNILNWIGENWMLLVGILTGPIGYAIAWVISNWGSIVQFFQDTITNIGNFFRDGFNAIVDFVVGLFDDFIRGIRITWEGLLSFFRDFPKMIGDFFGGIGSWLFDAGKNLIQGLFDGINSLAGTIGKFFLDILPGWLVEPFKVALGIHSPSKLFRGFGENIGQGILDGVSDLQPEIDSQMSGLVSVPALPDSVNGRMGNVDNSTSNRSFTYVAAPGNGFSAEDDLFSALGRGRAAGAF